MAKLYHTMGPEFEQKTVDAFEKSLRKKEQQQVNDREMAECLAYLSRYYKKIGNVEKSIEYSRRLVDLQGI
jgi:anaphase-promoting complex subunit 8